MSRIEEFGRRIGREFGAEKVRERIAMGDMLLSGILTEGRVLYNANDHQMVGRE